jgi:aldose 1-epimerase
MQIELRCAEHAVTIVEVGGGIRRYTLGDWNVLDGYGEDEMCSGARGQCLVPWPNRLRDGRYRFQDEEYQVPLSEPEKHNAIHGFVRWARWEVVSRGEREVVMRHLLHPRAGFPFALLVELEYRLSPEGLTVRTTATNVGAQPCPYGAGAHPYLTVGEDRIDTALLAAPGRRWMPTDDQGIPTRVLPVEGTPYDFTAARPIGSTRLDTGFTNLARDARGRASVELASADGRRTVSLWMDEAYRYLMLFTGDSLPDPTQRRRSLGVEPMTCAPNAFQSKEGLRILQPGESFTSTWGIRPVGQAP